MARQHDASGRTKLEVAADWLRRLLVDAPRFPHDIHAAAEAAGIEWRTLRRAKELLGVKSVRQRIVQTRKRAPSEGVRAARAAFKEGLTSASPERFIERASSLKTGEPVGPPQRARRIPGFRHVELGVPGPTKATEHGAWYWRLRGDEREPFAG